MMCTVCGCSATVVAEGARGHDHPHPHSHEHHHHDRGTIDFGTGLAGVSVPGLTQQRTLQIERDILSKNDGFAGANRTRLRNAGILALNFVSSPGSGKSW
jgi:hydrogenase nickel incorporation protein HypB